MQTVGDLLPPSGAPQAREKRARESLPWPKAAFIQQSIGTLQTLLGRPYRVRCNSPTGLPHPPQASPKTDSLFHFFALSLFHYFTASLLHCPATSAGGGSGPTPAARSTRARAAAVHENSVPAHRCAAHR